MGDYSLVLKVWFLSCLSRGGDKGGGGSRRSVSPPLAAKVRRFGFDILEGDEDTISGCLLRAIKDRNSDIKDRSYLPIISLLNMIFSI